MTPPRSAPRLERLWWREDATAAERLLLAPLLLPEVLFRAGVALRGALHARGLLAVEQAPAPVVSVGNLAVGGAGKTPVVIALAERLAARGRRPAILSRGYGSAGEGARVVADGTRLVLGARDGGDEAVLAALRLPGVPVLAGPDRAALARLAASSLGADALLLDDGFQHWRLARALDVVVLDAANPFGNRHLLPRGPNREPRSALSRAGLVWLAGADRAAAARLEELRSESRRLTGRDPVESRIAPRELRDRALERTYPLAELSGRRVALLTGVARPDRVRRTVEELGATVAVERSFADHHPFHALEVEEVLEAARSAGADLVVTTEKDAVRLPALPGGTVPLRALRIDVEVLRGEASLQEALDGALRALPGGAAGAGGGHPPEPAGRGRS